MLLNLKEVLQIKFNLHFHYKLKVKRSVKIQIGQHLYVFKTLNLLGAWFEKICREHAAQLVGSLVSPPGIELGALPVKAAWLLIGLLVWRLFEI